MPQMKDCFGNFGTVGTMYTWWTVASCHQNLTDWHVRAQHNLRKRHHDLTLPEKKDIQRLKAIYTVSQKKTSHFNFRHNFTICWDIFTIFEAPCSGLIAGWCNLLHTHHRCEAFTWRDITHDVIQAVARRAQWHCRFHTTWRMVSAHRT